jgi:hypothetical protein
LSSSLPEAEEAAINGYIDGWDKSRAPSDTRSLKSIWVNFHLEAALRYAVQRRTLESQSDYGWLESLDLTNSIEELRLHHLEMIERAPYHLDQMEAIFR